MSQRRKIIFYFIETIKILLNNKILLFNNKDKVKHYSCVIYHGICSCGADCIGEMIRNSEIRWN